MNPVPWRLQGAGRPIGSGVTLVELMVSLAAGLLLVVAATAIYLKNKQAWLVLDNMTTLQESGRFALTVLREDIRLAGYWGLNTSPASIVNAEPVALDGECFSGWATNYTLPLAGANNTNAGRGACIPAEDYEPGTDIVTVRRSSSEPVAVDSIREEHLYLYTSLTEGAAFIADDAAGIDDGIQLEESPAALYRVLARAYYIRPWSGETGDGIPTLVRETISAGRVAAEPLVELVEDLQVTFGLDTDGDGGVDSYRDELPPGTAGGVVSVLLELLVRAPREEADYVNSRQYRIGGGTRAFDDGFRRQVFRETVYLRNRQMYGS